MAGALPRSGTDHHQQGCQRSPLSTHDATDPITRTDHNPRQSLETLTEIQPIFSHLLCIGFGNPCCENRELLFSVPGDPIDGRFKDILIDRVIQTPGSTQVLCGHNFRPLTCHPVVVLGFLQCLRWEVIFKRRPLPNRESITIETQPANMLIRMFG